MPVDFEIWPAPPKEPFAQWDCPELQAVLDRLSGHWLHPLLDEHQRIGAAFLASRQGALLGDEMGLGKTRQAIAGVILANATPCLIIAPAGGRFLWDDELRKMCGESMTVANDASEITTSTEWVVVPYSRLAKMASVIKNIGFRSVIIDEAHAIKNKSETPRERAAPAAELPLEEPKKKKPSKHRTEWVFEVARFIPRVYCVTGTPLLSRVKELFNLLAITRHPLGDKAFPFFIRYCAAKQSRFGWNLDGASNLEELNIKLRGWLLMRSKRTTLARLPQKTARLSKVTLCDADLETYRSAWNRYLTEVLATKGKRKFAGVIVAQAMVKLGVLRQTLSIPKAREAARRALEHDGKTIIFSCYTETVEFLQSTLGEGVCVTYQGGMSETEKRNAVETFQTDPKKRFFVSNLDAGKTGLTLTAADLVLSVDFAWTPSDHYQAEDRAHRRGQTKPVRAVYFYCPGTIDDHMVAFLAAKRRTINSVFEPHPMAEAQSADGSVASALARQLVEEAMQKAASEALAA